MHLAMSPGCAMTRFRYSLSVASPPHVSDNTTVSSAYNLPVIQTHEHHIRFDPKRARPPSSSKQISPTSSPATFLPSTSSFTPSFRQAIIVHSQARQHNEAINARPAAAAALRPRTTRGAHDRFIGFDCTTPDEALPHLEMGTLQRPRACVGRYQRYLR